MMVNGFKIKGKVMDLLHGFIREIFSPGIKVNEKMTRIKDTEFLNVIYKNN